MQDQEIQCVDCPNTFVFTAEDQEFLKKKHGSNYAAPKRCKECRIKKAERMNGGSFRKN